MGIKESDFTLSFYFEIKFKKEIMTSPATPKISSMDAFINSFRNKIPSLTEDRSPIWDEKIREARAKYNDFIIVSEYLLNMEFSLTFILPKIYS